MEAAAAAAAATATVAMVASRGLLSVHLHGNAPPTPWLPGLDEDGRPRRPSPKAAARAARKRKASKAAAKSPPPKIASGGGGGGHAHGDGPLGDIPLLREPTMLFVRFAARAPDPSMPGATQWLSLIHI